MRVAVGIGAVMFVVFVAVAVGVPAQRGGSSLPTSAAGTDVNSSIVASAQKVLGALDEAGRAKLQFPVNS
jgi:hypothetical protein